MADAAMQRWPKGVLSSPGKRLHYELGTLLQGMDALWYATADGRYYQYIQDSIDPLIASGGGLSSDHPDTDSLDDVLLARQLLLLYRVTEDKQYYRAAAALQLRLAKDASVSSDQGPVDDRAWQSVPFLAEYASVFQEPQRLAEITRRFASIDQHSPDSKAAPGLSMARFMMGLVDALPYYPEDDAGRAQLIDILKRTAAGIVRSQDAGSGVWRQVPGKTSEKDTVVESVTASLITYALAKGMRLGYLPREYESNAEHAWRGIQSRTPKPESVDDPQSVGAFLLAATEMEHAPDAKIGQGSTVLLDAWYNSQTRSNAAGQKVLFHYKWDDFSNSGYSLLGHIFRGFGVRTETLPVAPTRDNLKGARLYVIVSPDNLSKKPQPHYMSNDDAREVAAWVKQGGVLVVMENDPDNADITHMDALADIFGLHFNNVLTHHVVGDQFEMGRMDLPHPTAPFTSAHVLYMKDTCSLSLSRGAIGLLEWKDDTMMAVAHYGKGTVVAVTDPWLYNEYTDGRKLPADYDNFAAGREFVRWLLQQP